MYEPFGTSPKSPSRMAFQQKILPSISGGRRADTFNREFRVRFSWIKAFSCSSICFSNACIELRLISRSIAVRTTASIVVEWLEVSYSHQWRCQLTICGGSGSIRMMWRKETERRDAMSVSRDIRPSCFVIKVQFRRADSAESLSLYPPPRSPSKKLIAQHASVAVCQLSQRVGEEGPQAMRTMRVRVSVPRSVRHI